MLLDVKGVGRAAAIGRADDVFGQVPVAFVQPTEDVALSSLEELAALVDRIRIVAGERLPSAHRPVVIHVVAEIPLHATGKVHTSSLRQDDVTVIYEERL
jgi:acyl-coenzyme A synthetase/AMP-(fatty) acid ligase